METKSEPSKAIDLDDAKEKLEVVKQIIEDFERIDAMKKGHQTDNPFVSMYPKSTLQPED